MVQKLKNELHRFLQAAHPSLWLPFHYEQQGSSAPEFMLSLSMCKGETLRAYSDRYWEMYNKMDSNYDDIAINMIKSGLPTEHCLRKSLTSKPITSIRQLMDRINKYKRVEKDQLQGKGKEKIIPHKRNDFRSERYNNNHPRFCEAIWISQYANG